VKQGDPQAQKRLLEMVGDSKTPGLQDAAMTLIVANAPELYEKALKELPADKREIRRAVDLSRGSEDSAVSKRRRIERSGHVAERLRPAVCAAGGARCGAPHERSAQVVPERGRLVPVVLRGPDGQTINADDAKIGFWVNQGYKPVSEDELGQEIAARAEQPEDRGILGGVNALVTRTLSGMTLGGSDVVLGGLMNQGQRQRLSSDIDQHQTAGLVGQVAGEVLPAIATGGESLAMEGLPAARLSRFAGEVGEMLPGSGAISRVGRLAATGATEGAVSNAGQYLGQMALSDKPAECGRLPRLDA
jgi:hypothetical protein